MKVLLIHQHFNTPSSGGAIRSYYLAKALVDKGVEVIVLTSANNQSQRIKNYEGIVIHSLSIPYDNKFGFLARSWSFIKFVVGAINYSAKIKGVDYCYAISTPLTVGLIAIWLKILKKIPFFFEVGDLWPEAPIQMGFIQNYFLKEVLYRLEKSIYQSAHSIVALSTSIKTEIEKKAPGKNIHLIPNFADCEFYKPSEKSSSLEIKFKTTGKFVVSYIGAIGLANGLDYFLECANASRKAELPIQFLVCGEGALRERLIANAQQLGLKNLTFIDFQTRTGVQEVMNVTDATFICYKNLPVLETGSPNKYFDGLAAGKLIITNFDGWIKREIEEGNCGIFSDPNHPTDFVKKITPFLPDAKALKNYQFAARELAERKYSRKILSEEFYKLFT